MKEIINYIDPENKIIKYKCFTCDKDKLINEFTIRNGEPINNCKKCRAILANKYYHENKEKILSKEKAKYNTDAGRAASKKYRIKNKDKIKENNKKNYENNKEKNKQYSRDYYRNNKEAIILKQNIRLKNKRKSDPILKLRHNFSCQIRQQIMKGGKSFIKYLNYSIEDLKNHIQNLFEPWMTWENWGVFNSNTWSDQDDSTWTWQIDHIIPQSLLLYSSMEDENFKKCWALENLRPYPAKKNITDGNRR